MGRKNGVFPDDDHLGANALLSEYPLPWGLFIHCSKELWRKCPSLSGFFPQSPPGKLDLLDDIWYLYLLRCEIEFKAKIYQYSI